MQDGFSGAMPLREDLRITKTSYYFSVAASYNLMLLKVSFFISIYRYALTPGLFELRSLNSHEINDTKQVSFLQVLSEGFNLHLSTMHERVVVGKKSEGETVQNTKTHFNIKV